MVTTVELSYGVVAGIAWGLVLYGQKRYFATMHSATFMTVVFACAAVWYAPVTVTEFLATETSVITSLRTLGVMLLSISLLVVGLSLMFRAISLGEVSYVSPITRIAPVFVIPVEILLFGEQFTMSQTAGILLATTAIYLMNYEGEAMWIPIQRAVTYRPGRLALGSAGTLALLSVAQRYVLQELAVPSTVWIGVKLAGAALLLGPIGWTRATPERIRNGLGPFLILGLLIAVGEHFVGLAFAALPASIASPLVGTQAIVAILLGGTLLGEGRTRQRLVAALMAIAGIGLISI
jgi:drug/metabolite transporter (DMT)-like permease